MKEKIVYLIKNCKYIKTLHHTNRPAALRQRGSTALRCLICRKCVLYLLLNYYIL